MPITLRDYQQAAIGALFEYWEEERGRNPLIVCPTGAGKSLIIGEVCKKICTESPHVRILVIAHVKELILQNEAELKGYWPGANTGIYSAGVGQRNTTAQIIFAGIQSVFNRAFEFGKIDIVVIDEAHSISREAQTRYGKFLKDLKTANPNIVLVGCTATPFRMSEGLLHEGDGALFDGIAHCTEIKKLIKEGYLVPPISKGGVRKIDLTNVHLQAGEYNSSELAYAADDPELIRQAVEEVVNYGKDRRAWLVYASGVLHAQHVLNEIKKNGVDCEMVTGETPKEERDEIIARFKDGKIKCLVNVMVLAVGFNAPICDMIALLTATKSAGKYIQICGRGLRTHPGKENCLILDYGSNILTHGPLDEIDPIKRKNIFCMEKKAPPMKECPQCRAIVHARVTECACGYKFPVSAPHGSEAYAGAVLAEQIKPEVVPIAGTWISRHTKAGSPDSVKVCFYTQLDKEYYMWLGLDHSGYYREKSLATVRKFGGKANTVEEALKESPYWKPVSAIQVRPRGKYWDVLGIVFGPNQQSKDGKAVPQQQRLV